MNKNEKQIKPMLCPVCGEFYFTKINRIELELGYKPSDKCCSVCGWRYDLEQTKDPDLKNQANSLSLNEYKADYEKKRSENPDYNYLEMNAPAPARHKCPVCGEYTFEDVDSYDICPVCGWEDDGYFSGGGANEMSLDEAIADFQKRRSENPKYKWIDQFEK